MAIGIVTFYDSYNYGAFWQAKALEYYLNKSFETEVYFVKTGQRKFWVEYARRINSLRMAKMLSYKSCKFNYKLCRMIERFKGEFIEKDKRDISEGDTIVFGSDEIWNIKRKVNRAKSAGILWGRGIPEKVLRIAYAPSVNDSNESIFGERRELIKDLEKFTALSGRDYRTCDLIGKMANKKVEQVVDPTLLPDLEYYLKQQVLPEKNNYILIYSYGNKFKKKDIENIKQFGSRLGKKIISFGNYLNFADENVYGSPQEFLGYFYNASIIITDTFHGTMFSMIYKKPLVLFVHHEGKLSETVTQYGLEKFVQRGEISEDRLIMDYDLIWNRIENTLNGYRDFSREYVKKCIKANKKREKGHIDE